MRKIFVLTVAALLGSAAFAAGDIYRWKDAGGVWHYSDQPHPGAELMSRNSTAGTTPSSTTTPAAVPAAAQPAPPPGNDALPVSKEVAAEVLQETAKARAETCKKAEKDYQDAVRALRGYTTDTKGERKYYSDEEMNAARMQARATRDLACKS